MKAILIEPGRDPEIVTAPESLQGIEARLGGHSEMRVFPRVPAAIFFSVGSRPRTQSAVSGPLDLWANPLLRLDWQ